MCTHILEDGGHTGTGSILTSVDPGEPDYHNHLHEESSLEQSRVL